MIYHKLCILLLFLPLLLFAGCETHKNNIYESPKKQTYMPYSDLARISHLSLEHDGYIIGIEKRARTETGEGIGVEIDYAPGIKDKRERFSIVPVPDGTLPDDCCLTTEKEKKRFKRNVQKRNEKFINYISDKSVIYVSHIASYVENKVEDKRNYNKFRKPFFLYNAYDKYKNDKPDYKKGYEVLEIFKEDLKQKIRDNKYSHIILFCMGWNNNQQESIYRYNKIVSNLKKIVQDENENNDQDKKKIFKPLIIGLTWPSSWLTIEDSLIKKYLFFFASYFTKQDDADEIGMTVANWLTNNIVLKVKNEIKNEPSNEVKNYNLPKVIAIGHSMGARILSRAIFSDGYLEPKQPKLKDDFEVDLFIGLQGAFSANRFVAFNGWEGSPYAELCKRETVFSLTTSENDNANPFAAFITGAKHTGGRYGLKIAEKEKNTKIFEKVVIWSKNDMRSKLAELKDREKNKVIMIDVSSILVEDKKRKPDPTDAHNDILDTDMAELIWALIDNFANYSNSK